MWSTHVDTWDACWEAVQSVDSLNFDILLGNIKFGRQVYAGPVARGGKVINADAALRLSLARFVTVVDIRRGYYNTRCGCGRVEEAVG